jgi:hypothetical protein
MRAEVEGQNEKEGGEGRRGGNAEYGEKSLKARFSRVEREKE